MHHVRRHPKQEAVSEKLSSNAGKKRDYHDPRRDSRGNIVGPPV